LFLCLYSLLFIYFRKESDIPQDTVDEKHHICQVIVNENCLSPVEGLVKNDILERDLKLPRETLPIILAFWEDLKRHSKLEKDICKLDEYARSHSEGRVYVGLCKKKLMEHTEELLGNPDAPIKIMKILLFWLEQCRIEGEYHEYFEHVHNIAFRVCNLMDNEKYGFLKFPYKFFSIQNRLKRDLALIKGFNSIVMKRRRLLTIRIKLKSQLIVNTPGEVSTGP
jgi:hypothetical protein